MRFLVFAACLGMTLSLQFQQFQSFSTEFSKSYKSIEDLELRREIFNANFKKMVEHNKRYDAGEVTWWQKVHEDMDLTEDEWLQKRTGGLPAFDSKAVLTDTLDERILKKISEMGQAPREVNWVDMGAVSSVKNQGQCGSCAAFSVIGAVESCYNIQHNSQLTDLSEQHILDCAYNHYVNDDSGSWGAFGCDGAWPNAYMDWLMDGKQNQEEFYYPYTSGSTGDVTSCRPKDSGYHKGEAVTGMYNRWFPNELDMEEVVAINPVSTSLLATSNWGGYGGGVHVDPACCDAAYDSNCINKLNHAILVVGYGHDSASGLDYWLIKNSWGTRWGADGFMKLKKGTGHCGVGSLHQTIPYCE